MTAFKNPATWVAFIIGMCALIGHGAFGPVSPAIEHLVNGASETAGLFGSLFLAATFGAAKQPRAVADPPDRVVPEPVAKDVKP